MARHRVLIVEDEQDIAGLIKHTLERGGETEAQIVGSGDAALKAVTERAPDLIILDLNLPVVGGLEVCRILRSRADVPHVPIIMLTARTSEDDRVSGLEQGADDYVTKPFSLRELTARVRAVLRRGPAAEPRPGPLSGRPADRRLRRRGDRRRRRPGPPDAPRVRAAPVSGAEQEPRRLARSAARARVGLRAAGRDALGRRPRRAAAEQAADRRAARSRPSSASATGSSIDRHSARASAVQCCLTLVRFARASRRIAMAERVQSYKKHTRFLPPFHFFVMPVLLVNFLNAVRHLWLTPTLHFGVGGGARRGAADAGVHVAGPGADGAGPRDPARDAAAAARAPAAGSAAAASTR